MNYRDHWTTDEHGKKFIFTVEMQRRLNEAGLPVEPASLSALGDTRQGRRPSARPAERAYASGSSRSGDYQSGGQEAESATFEAPETVQIDPQTGKYIGRMKWYNSKKGYGFIVRGGGEEIFFHKSGTTGDPEALAEGQWVLYDVEETRKGPEATEIEPYEGDTELLA